MEMRIIIWNTLDTAPKDGYTSDVYMCMSCEMLGVGQPKLTGTHYSVKVKAYGTPPSRLFRYLSNVCGCEIQHTDM